MPSFGETLRRERELRGVDLRDIAEATNISLRFLQALEQDRMDVLPGGIFPKAFVRQYATYLGLDPDRLVAEYVYTHGGPATEGGASPQRPASGRMAAVFFGLILVAGVALFASARAGLFALINRNGLSEVPSLPDAAMRPAQDGWGSMCLRVSALSGEKRFSASKCGIQELSGRRAVLPDAV